jgi:hypothetical protein
MLRHFHLNIISVIIFAAMLGGCDRLAADKVSDFIPGTYVRTFEHEYARGSDTIVIARVNGTHFLISKRSGFQRIKNGRMLPKELRGEQSAAVFREGDGVLEDERTRRVYVFDVRGRKLHIGNNEYVKLP